MKRVSLATLALLVGAAACQDAVTSPQINSDLQYAISSNPPPPPIDTGAIGRFSANPFLRAPRESPFLQPRFSILQSSAPELRTTVLGSPGRLAFTVGTSFDFSVPVKYELNKKGDHGELKFRQIKHSYDIDVIKGCKVKFEHGEFKGKGMLEIQLEDGVLVIDCSSVNQNSSFETCGEGELCFNVFFDIAIFYPTVGDPIEGTVEAQTGCPPDNTDEGCPIFEGID